MFELRDTQSGSSFSGRVNDVFSALGSGSVKQPDKLDDKNFTKPDFDQQQLKRSIRQTDRPPASHKKRETDRQQGSEFKHPAELLKAAGGGGGGNRHEGDHQRREENRHADGYRRGGGGRGGRPARGRKVPDFKKNPGKWTKYSLADVDNMTDRSNTAAALQFLQTLKNKTEDDQPAFDPSQKLVFKKPLKKKETSSRVEDHQQNQMTKETQAEDSDDTSSNAANKGSFVGSKQIMPEFNFGVKRNKDKPEKTPTKSAKHSKEMKLSHLDDEECDE